MVSKLKDEALSERVCRILRDDLISGRYKAGEKVKISTVANDLGVSPTPVREAIRLLIAAGGLNARPNHTVTAAAPSPEEYQEVSRLRMELEGLAAHDAALYRSDKQLKEFISLNEKMEAAREKQRFDIVLQYNRTLHFSLCDMAKLPVTASVLESLWLRVGPTFNLLYSHASAHWPVKEERHPHLDLIDALVRQDPEQARQAIQRDIRLGTEVVLRELRSGKKMANCV